MYYTPHILQLKVISAPDRDSYNRPIPGTGSESWQDVCRCRCDDNTTTEFKSDNGQVYRPDFHVVCECNIALKAGDYVRCMDDDEVRGEGEVYKVKNTNYLGYSELWM